MRLVETGTAGECLLAVACHITSREIHRRMQDMHCPET